MRREGACYLTLHILHPRGHSRESGDDIVDTEECANPTRATRSSRPDALAAPARRNRRPPALRCAARRRAPVRCDAWRWRPSLPYWNAGLPQTTAGGWRSRRPSSGLLVDDQAGARRRRRRSLARDLVDHVDHGLLHLVLLAHHGDLSEFAVRPLLHCKELNGEIFGHDQRLGWPRKRMLTLIG